MKVAAAAWVRRLEVWEAEVAARMAARAKVAGVAVALAAAMAMARAATVRAVVVRTAEALMAREAVAIAEARTGMVRAAAAMLGLSNSERAAG